MTKKLIRNPFTQVAQILYYNISGPMNSQDALGS